MISTIELTVTNETGILGRIAISLIKNGFKVVGQSVSGLDNQDQCLMTFRIEASQAIVNSDIEYLKTEILEIIEIHGETKATTVTATPVAAEDVKTILKSYGEQVIEKFPDINEYLTGIDHQLAPSNKEEILTKLGKGIGRWQCKKNYALGGLLDLDKTLERMLWLSLNDFLSIEASGNMIAVSDCPHCSGQQVVDTQPSCFFIIGYIQGFLGFLEHLPVTTVIQLHSKATGHKSCDFEIRSDAE